MNLTEGSRIVVNLALAQIIVSLYRPSDKGEGGGSNLPRPAIQFNSGGQIARDNPLATKQLGTDRVSNRTALRIPVPRKAEANIRHSAQGVDTISQ